MNTVRIIRMKRLTEKIGLGRSTIYRKVNEGTFPAPFSLGAGRARGWLESDVDQWIETHAACEASASEDD